MIGSWHRYVRELDDTGFDNVVPMEAPMVKYARRVCNWLGRKKGA
tara:strand:- start:715 stop:849 length:135 start_codon:yes stop_codon:yes gene_type:complete